LAPTGPRLIEAVTALKILLRARVIKPAASDGNDEAAN
jgi:hypothetical protein